MERVVFSIDNYYDLKHLARFLKQMDTQRVTGNLKGQFKVLHGSYNNEPEISFMMAKEDFESFVIPFGWVDNQESLLIIYPDNSTVLKYRDKVEYLGTWTNVSRKETKESWTYDPKDKTWWTCI